MNKIQKISAEKPQTEKEEVENKRAKYQYLVGKCVHIMPTSYEKITEIVRVNTYELDDVVFDDEVIYKSIHFYIDNTKEADVDKLAIYPSFMGNEFAKKINKKIISQEEFNNIVDSSLALIKKISINV